MIYWVWLIPAFMVGGCIGFITLALVAAAKDDQ